MIFVAGTDTNFPFTDQVRFNKAVVPHTRRTEVTKTRRFWNQVFPQDSPLRASMKGLGSDRH